MKIKQVVANYRGLTELLRMPVPPVLARSLSRRADALADIVYEHDLMVTELRERHKVPNPPPPGYLMPSEYIKEYHSFLQEERDVEIDPLRWETIESLKGPDGKPMVIAGNVIDSLLGLLKEFPDEP